MLLLSTGSCVEPYLTPPIEAPEGLLVVDGYLNSGFGQSFIQLSRTQNLADTIAPQPELHAQIFFEGDRGTVLSLSEKENGVYSLANTNVMSNENYRLRIKTSTGREYASEYVSVKATPALDSVSWKAEEDGLQLYANTHDEQNNTWY